MNPDRLKIFTGSANPALAEELLKRRHPGAEAEDRQRARR